MALRSEPVVAVLGRALPWPRRWIKESTVFSWLMLAPPLLFLIAFVGYPFIYGIWLSLEDRQVARSAIFVGLGNFLDDARDPVFWQVVRNTFVYTFAATVLKAAGGLALALVLNQNFPMKNLVRALVLLPFIVPTVLSTIAWMWILDPAFSVLNWFLVHMGVPKPGPSWLGNSYLAMGSLIVVNTWRGLPFYAITLLAGLQTIPGDIYEAARIDGAGEIRMFRKLTLPLLRPIMAMVVILTVISAFQVFDIVAVATGGPQGTPGGPANASNVLPLYIYNTGFGEFDFGYAVTMSMALFVMLLAITFTQMRLLRANQSDLG